MKTSILNSLFVVSLHLILASCVIPESNHVRPTYHLLSALGSESNESITQGEVSFYVRQVELPTYLQDNRLVSRPSKGLIEFRENDRWGESLEEGIARVLGLNLSRRLNTFSYSVYPHRKKVSCMYDFVVAIQRFERISSEAVLLEAICEIHFERKVDQIRFVKKIELAGTGKEEERVGQEILALSQAMKELSTFLALRVTSSAGGDP